MTTTINDRRHEILALESRLLECADTLTHDETEAGALVGETLKMAKDLDYGAADAVSAQVWIFRLLRQRFYSVERVRDYRRSRSAVVTELGYARKRALLAQAASEAADAL